MRGFKACGSAGKVIAGIGALPVFKKGPFGSHPVLFVFDADWFCSLAAA